MSSYDPVPGPDGMITPEQFKQSMKLVRLQIAVPISVLISVGANLVCALALKPGLDVAGLNALHPTLLSPNSIMVGVYWAILYLLQVGFCLVLLIARKEETKQTLVHGVGLRFAIANWIQAAWAVAFTLQLFAVSEILILINVINVLSIHLTLLKYPPTYHRPLDTIFIHAPISLLFAILFELDWLHNGFIALGWDIKDQHMWTKYTWQAVGSLAGVNFVMALWEGITRQYLLTGASVYLLFTILFSSPRSQPTLPTTALPKPTPLLITLIIMLVLHPVALVAGMAWKRTREREGRIRLEEEVREAEAEERAVEHAADRRH